MIGFNGKSLLAAAIGDMRIITMSQGDKLLLGSGWLMKATKDAIKSVFGAEGAGVFQATNAYLNGIAATNITRAQQLAGFINEDPMLVTSIVETSKTRWLVGDGKAYIDSDFCAISQKYKVSIKFHKNGSQVSNWRSICGVNIGSDGEKQYSLFQFNNTNEDNLVYHNTDANSSVSVPLGGINEFTASMECEIDRTICKLNGNQVGVLQGAINNDPNYNYGIFVAKKSSTLFLTPAVKGGLAFYIFEEESNEHHLLPFIRNNECGMIDILTGTFYANANTEGAFTITLE